MAAFWFRRDWATLRPWLTGMVVLATLIWAISWLLDAQQITGEGAAEEQASATAAARAATVSTNASNLVPVPLSDLLPLGPEDDGFRVVVRGTVVGEPIDEGFWVLTDEDEVLFVFANQPVNSGEDRTLTGTLHQIAEADGAARAAQARLREAAGWKVHHNLYLEVDGAAPSPSTGASATPSSAGAATPRPGAARTTPRDTT